MKYFKAIFLITIISLILPAFLIAQQGSMDWTCATDSAGWAVRLRHASVAFNNKIWVLGGYVSSAGQDRRNDVWYSSDGANWICATESAGWSKRYYHTAVVFDNKIWVLGGNATDGSRKNDVWYSVDGINWTRACSSAQWSRRRNHTSVVFDNKIWVMGGNASDGTRKNDVWYSTDGINWTQATASADWPARYDYCSVVFDNKMWVMGGNAASASEVDRNDVWYSADGINWTCATANAAWTARDLFAAVVLNNKIWVLGGRPGTSRRNDVWYSNDGIDWICATSAANWSRRCSHTAVSFNDRIWVLGGDATLNGDDVWFSRGYMATLVSPVGGETLYGGSTQTIRWRTGCTTFTSTRLLFSKDGGATYDDTIGQNILPSETTYQWTLPYVNSKQCRVMVQIVEGDSVRVQDASDVNFIIQTVYVVSPNGGEIFTGGASQTIQWRTFYPGAVFYRLLFTHDYNEPETIADNLTMVDTLFNWTVPLINSEFCRIKIQMKDSTGDIVLEDSSDREFTIRTLTLLVPNGDEYWAGGSNKLIKWRTYTQVGFSKHQLLLSIDGGQTFSDTIADNVLPTESTYVWQVPIINSNMCQVKVEIMDSINEVLCFDMSDEYFVIDAEPPSTFSLLSPTNYGWAGRNSSYSWEPASDNFWLSYYQFAIANPNETLTANTYISTYLPGGGTNWTNATMSAGWTGRSYHSSVVFDNKIWVLGGEDEDDVRNDVWRSIDGTNWIEVTSSAGWLPRYNHKSVVFDSKIWVIGGEDYNNVFNDVWYSSDGVSWTCATDSASWAQRACHSSVVYDNKIWVLGGYDSNYDELNDVWYSLDGINWVQATASAQWGARYYHTSIVFDNKIWIIGGGNNDVWYSLDGASWTCATDSAGWGIRSNHTSVVFDNRMWLLGGFGNDVWFSVNGINWVCATTSAGWSARNGHASVVFDNKMWVIGGDWMNDVWYSGLPLHFSQGLHHWWVTAFDRAGNSRRSTESFTVRVDTIYPTTPILSTPNDSVIINDSIITFAWRRAHDIPSGIMGYRMQVYAIPYVEPCLDTIINDTLTSLWLVDSTYKWHVCAIDSGGNRSGWSNTRTFTFHSVGIEQGRLPLSALRLSLKIYPNPAKSLTAVYYSLPAKTRVSLVLYDISGRMIKTFVNEEKEPGIYTANFKTNNLSAGIYFVRLQVGDKKRLIERMVVVK